MDIRRMKVWMLDTPFDDQPPLAPDDTKPDCLCLPVTGCQNLSERVSTLRTLLPALPVFLICDPISEAYNVSAFTAAASAAPDGIILRGVEHAARIQMAETLLRVVEARNGLDEGSIALIAMIGDNAGGLLNAGQFSHRLERLIALGYDAFTLDGQRNGDDKASDSMRYGAVATMLAARRLGIPAIDFTGSTVEASLYESDCERAARSGFAGKLAAHPAHIGMIKQAFGNA
ncbi:hypothetical protein [Martelella mediterranea]|uniref:Citrate lyase subunit beta/citryl-CoA lyase n=1 Tax=Martelella mediterranea TaxID=293089 RepID=A0A4R3NU18_9HYPH|nr:hypothetical protein [Martelella mediterranea]TCT40909.1 citrate lyase subunit beta/citryl-CoA lyase [Martelella mediterranea]